MSTPLFRYEPFWEEWKEDLSPEAIAYHSGYEDGYYLGSGQKEHLSDVVSRLERRISQLEGLLSANVRVMKQQIFKELQDSGQIPKTATPSS